MRHVAEVGWALARASHPFPAVAVTAMAAGLGVTSGAAPGAAAVLAAAVFAGQLSVGWLNDLVDAERDAAVHRAGKPVAAGAVPRRVVWAATALSGVGAVVLSLPFGPAAAGAHLLALGSAWAYDLGVKGTALSVLPYVVSFGLLPVFITLAAADRFPPAWLAAAAALLGAGAHFANAQPDLADDRATGVRGLPHRLGTTGALVAAAALVLAATGVLLTAPEVRWQLLPVSAGVVGTGFLLSHRPGSRAAFRAIVLVALLNVAVLLSTGPPR